MAESKSRRRLGARLRDTPTWRALCLRPYFLILTAEKTPK